MVSDGSEERRNEQYAYFFVIGAFDPQEITRRVSIAPSESWLAGESSPIDGHTYTFSRWALYSRLSRDSPLEFHIRDVLTQLQLFPGAFHEISKEYGGYMQLVGSFKDEYPGLCLERDIVEALADFSLSVDFDFYFRDRQPPL